jgi:antitoxin VapB
VALSIKTDEADRLARELAAETKESLTEAVTIALRERLDRVRGDRRRPMTEALNRLADEYSQLSVADPRAPEEIIGYDEHGLPA